MIDLTYEEEEDLLNYKKTTLKKLKTFLDANTIEYYPTFPKNKLLGVIIEKCFDGDLYKFYSYNTDIIKGRMRLRLKENEFVHFSENNTKLRVMDSNNKLSSIDYKPHNSLWSSTMSKDIRTWFDMCSDGNLRSLKYCYIVKIDFSRIYIINNVKEFDSFSKKYGVVIRMNVGVDDIKYCWLIDWDRVRSAGYTGISIIPYLYARRYTYLNSCLLWYATWDVETVCVWDSSAIISYKVKEFSKMKAVSDIIS